jgi:hypothetical protein
VITPPVTAEAPNPPAESLPETGPATLPDASDPVEADSGSGATTSATPVIIPPVTVLTVLRPARILWLFVIGLVVFMIAYGIQVFVWYRLRK